MRIAVAENGGKGSYLIQRLEARGHELVQRIDDIDLLVIDCDWPWAGPRNQQIQLVHDQGGKIVLYPHGGWPTVGSYDGLCEPNPLVDLRLEHGPGSVEIARMFGRTDLKQHATGWLFSPTQPFSPVEKPRNVLFCAEHPNMADLHQGRPMNGHDPAPAANQPVYKALLDTGLDLTVLLVGPAHRNGIWPHPKATFIQNDNMEFTRSYQIMRDADVVVAEGTMAALAVALGKPTVMMGQTRFSDYIDGVYREAAHAELFRPYMRYPIDVGDGDIRELIEQACAGDTGAAEWRQRFVGDDGTEDAVTLLEEQIPLREPERSDPVDVAIGGVTASIAGTGR